MASTFFGLTIASSGLRAANAALNTTGNNISNVNTLGYSRQEVNTEAANALRVFATYGCAGAGAVYNQGDTIPNEKLKKIWTKFYRDNRSKYSGSGLGLAIVAQILSMQKLSYGAKNLADGVQFYFSIPTIK